MPHAILFVRTVTVLLLLRTPSACKGYLFMNCQAIILAAGKSSRFNTGRSKLVEPICGQPMVLYPVQVMAQLQIPTTVVVGHHKEIVQETISHAYPATTYIEQTTQKGTGDAIRCTRAIWQAEDIFILNGDTPLVDALLLQEVYEIHRRTGAVMTFVTAHNIDPLLGNYGRVVTTDNQIAIIEAKDFTEDASQHTLINAGVYLLNRTFLEENIDRIPASAVTGEIYFTELVRMASQQGLIVQTVETNFDQVRGVNTLRELWVIEQLKKSAIIEQMLANGVRFEAPQTNRVDLANRIGQGSFIGTGVQLIGTCIIGQNCIIEPFVILKDVILEDDSIIRAHSIVEEVHLPAHSHVGPLVHMHATESETLFQGAVYAQEASSYSR